MPAHSNSLFTSSSSPSLNASLLSSPDVLLGPPHFRLLRWIYQYVAAFPALTQTRQEIEGLMEAQAEEPHLHPSASTSSLSLLIEETRHRASLRECFDCLTRDEGLYDGVGPGLSLLREATEAAGLDMGPTSSLFELTQLVVIKAAMRAAEDTVREENEAEEKGEGADIIDLASSRFDDILRDLLHQRTGGRGVTVPDTREQTRLLSHIHTFCTAYRDLVRLSLTSKSSSKQLHAVQSLYPQQRLVKAVTAVVVDVARGLNLPFPILNLVENEMVTKKLKITPPSLQPPSATSVIDLPPLPSISLPTPPPPPPAAARSTARTSTRGGRKGGSPARVTGAMGGQLKAARRQLNRRGVDPLHASIDEATELQEESESGAKVKGKTRATRGAPAREEMEESNLVVEEEQEVLRGDQEEEEEEEKAAQPVRKRRAVTSTPPDEKKEQPSSPRRLHRRAATRTSYNEDLIPIDIDEESGEEEASEEEEEEEEATSPPRAGRGKRKAASLSSSRKKKAKVSSLSTTEVRRGSRSKHRRPFSEEEEKWLTKGVAKYQDQHKKWHLILEKVQHLRYQCTVLHSFSASLTSCAHLWRRVLCGELGCAV